MSSESASTSCEKSCSALPFQGRRQVKQAEPPQRHALVVERQRQMLLHFGVGRLGQQQFRAQIDGFHVLGPRGHVVAGELAHVGDLAVAGRELVAARTFPGSSAIQRSARLSILRNHSLACSRSRSKP